MIRSRTALKWLSALAVLGLSAPLYAAPITLATGSTVKAIAEQDNGNTKTDNVTALPFSQTTSAADGDTTSTVISNLTDSKFNFDFSQNIPDFFHTSGIGDIFFTAGQSVTFSIAGFQTTFGGEYSQTLHVFLHDITAATSIYDYDNTLNVRSSGEQGSTLTLDSTGGSLTGSLIEGHLYEFSALQEMEVFTDPTGTGNVNISFAQTNPGPGPGPSVPLPAAFPTALLTALLAAGAMRLRKGQTQN